MRENGWVICIGLICLAFIIGIPYYYYNSDSDSKKYEYLKTETYEVESISIQSSKISGFWSLVVGLGVDVYIETTNETFVIDIEDIRFSKTEEEKSTMKVNSNNRQEILLTLNGKLAKDVSKEYAGYLGETLIFVD